MIMQTPPDRIAETFPHSAPLHITLHLSPSHELLEVIRMLLIRATIPAADPPLQQSCTWPDPQPERVNPTLETPPTLQENPQPEICESLVELYDRLLSEQDVEQKCRVKSIRENLSRLQEFEDWTDTRNAYPRIGPLKTLEIPGVLKEYANHLRSKPEGSSDTMCSKAISAIGKLAKACHEAGLIASIPKKPSKSFISQLKPKTAEERRITSVPVRVEELLAMLDVLDGCKWPKWGHVSASTFWKACLLSHYAYGFRSQDWFALQDQWKQGLLWSGVITETRCPVLDDLHNEHGWALYVVHKTDTKDQVAGRTSEVAVPLSREMRSLIEKFRGIHSTRVFPLTNNSTSYRREFGQILKRAGLSDTERLNAGKQIIKLSLGQKKIASFRKGSSAMWAKHGSKATSSYILHHALKDERVSKTTTESYLQSEEVLREMVEQIETLPIWQLNHG